MGVSVELFDKGKAWIVRITELGLLIIALKIVLQILFGTTVPFLDNNIIDNLIKLLNSLNSNDVVGLIAIAIVLYLFNRK